MEIESWGIITNLAALYRKASRTVKRGVIGPFRTYLFPYLQHETHYYDQLLYEDVHSDDN